MPILILLGVGVFYGIVALKEKCVLPTKYDINMSKQEKNRLVLENNQKRMNKIMRKYR